MQMSEMSEKIAEMHYELQKMHREQLYELHRLRDKVRIGLMGIGLLVVIAFILGCMM